MSDTITYLEEEAAGVQLRLDRARAAFLVHLVALATGLPPRMIMEGRRPHSRAVRARSVVVYILHITLTVPVPRVAAVFARDRTTISHLVHRVEDWRSDRDFDTALLELERCATAAPLEGGSSVLGAAA